MRRVRRAARAACDRSYDLLCAAQDNAAAASSAESAVKGTIYRHGRRADMLAGAALANRHADAAAHAARAARAMAAITAAAADAAPSDATVLGLDFTTRAYVDGAADAAAAAARSADMARAAYFAVVGYEGGAPS